jgi:uncharacterized protein YbbC (DUF1343 family)
MPRNYLLCAVLLVSLLCFSTPGSAAEVKTGAAVLQGSGFAQLQGKKYGLVTNQSAMVGSRHLLDLLLEAGIPPAVIFVPEHGLQGTREDGVPVADALERGIPVHSLYGGEKKPGQEDLAELDLLIFDIQDIGARFYTYISTMGLVMQGAAEAGLPLLILDRPNPLGGDYVAGFVSHSTPASFTSLYPIPLAHGMTVGELAQMIRGERLLPGLGELELSVVRMAGWERWMRWPDTGLAWTPTSPNIPDFPTALLYAGIGLLEGTGASEGRGTDTPFLLAGWPDIDDASLANSLNSEELPGVEFTATRFTPRSIPGRATAPKYRGHEVSGIGITVADYGALLPVETGVAVVRAIYNAVPAAERQKFFRQGITDLAGSLLLRQSVEKGLPSGAITALWHDDVAQFLAKRQRYLLYGGGSSVAEEAALAPAAATLPAAPKADELLSAPDVERHAGIAPKEGAATLR